MSPFVRDSLDLFLADYIVVRIAGEKEDEFEEFAKCSRVTSPKPGAHLSSQLDKDALAETGTTSPRAIERNLRKISKIDEHFTTDPTLIDTEFLKPIESPVYTFQVSFNFKYSNILKKMFNF